MHTHTESAAPAAPQKPAMLSLLSAKRTNSRSRASNACWARRSSGAYWRVSIIQNQRHTGIPNSHGPHGRPNATGRSRNRSRPAYARMGEQSPRQTPPRRDAVPPPEPKREHRLHQEGDETGTEPVNRRCAKQPRPVETAERISCPTTPSMASPWKRYLPGSWNIMAGNNWAEPLTSDVSTMIRASNPV